MIIQIKVTVLITNFPVVLFIMLALYKMVLAFESVDVLLLMLLSGT